MQDQGLFLQGLQEHLEWLNQTNENKQTPLMIASSKGQIEAVKLLIEVGVDLNLQDQEGWTALRHASC